MQVIAESEGDRVVRGHVFSSTEQRERVKKEGEGGES